MRRLPIPVVLLIVFLLPLLAAGSAGAVPIGDLHCNDSLGRPAAPYTVGTTVTVAGIVTAGTGTYATSYTDVYAQDSTGGIDIYKNTIPVTFANGDSITVTGTISQFHGLTEITMSAWTIFSHGHPLPAPKPMTCYGVANEFGANYCEPEEGMLIVVPHVTYTGTWGSGQSVTLHDETGTCTMYIAAATGVGGMPPPQGRFDAVGILKQYAGTSPPFTSGYELVPRSPSDVTSLEGPSFIQRPLETDIHPDRVTITWETDEPATSRVDYGYTENYELGSVGDSTLVTSHALTLTGLAPARIHVYRVTTAAHDGATVLGGLRFCSGSRSSGEMEAYFDRSVDASVAEGEAANGNADFVPILVNRINAAQHAIDVAIYNFALQGPADALIAAHQRGVEIRFVTEHDNVTQNQVRRLQAAGITVIDDTFGGNSGSGLMHDKFWVFDHRLDSDPANDWVLTGSWNLTSEGTYTDAQNALWLQDESLAEVYTAELDEMWGSTTATPDPNQSVFGSRKPDITPKQFVVGGRPVQVYFGPSDNTMAVFAARCAQARYSAHFCVLSFTRYDVGNALKVLFQTIPGFAVRGVFDSGEGNNASSQYQEMHGGGNYPWNPPADVWLDAEPGLLHHKYMLLDVNRHEGHPTVVTGSSNWSNAANNENDENMIYIEDFRLANLYYQEFAARYHAAGGTADLTAAVPDRQALAPGSLQVFPNPAYGSLTIRLDGAASGPVALTLLDAGGRRVAEKQAAIASAGVADLSWDVSGLGAGIYFLKVTGARGTERRTIAVLRR